MWVALGYSRWGAYTHSGLGISRAHAYRLLLIAHTVRALRKAAADRPSHYQDFRFRSEPGLCTAPLPDFSLSTSNCGSSFDAFTLRPAAFVLFVIFFFTVPGTVCPWLCQLTLSPLERSFFFAMPCSVPRRPRKTPRLTFQVRPRRTGPHPTDPHSAQRVTSPAGDGW